MSLHHIPSTGSSDTLQSVALDQDAFSHSCPKFSLPEKSLPSSVAYRLVSEEAKDFDINPRMNLATFCTTGLEDEALRLIMETSNTNIIDADEYRGSQEISLRCVRIVADLFNASKDAIGCATLGSSEAIMLGVLAMKRRWQQRMETLGRPTDHPALICSSSIQVCWEKAARYFEIELREIPLKEGQFVMNPDALEEKLDENCIGVCAILGSTYTGHFEPVEEIDAVVGAYNKAHGTEIGIHVDAASGGFVAPFVDPDLKWDFRLPNVVSINVSGHKFGMTNLGLGFAIWRDRKFLPESLVFVTSYLGSEQPNFTLNFSRSAASIVVQYYQFLRLGREGYTSIMERCRENALYLHRMINETGVFEVVSATRGAPLVAFRFKDEESLSFDAFDLSDRLRWHGWIVPAYNMAPDMQKMKILRAVVRETFTRDHAEHLIRDLMESVAYLKERMPLKKKEEEKEEEEQEQEMRATKKRKTEEGHKIAVSGYASLFIGAMRRNVRRKRDIKDDPDTKRVHKVC
eukprot:TRINITY_DN3870_c0_g1_i1.p1 TRINITY_DN3870_c0_g1~~TRINITY_DN3870_c0_g1_i1.p1  ORF type:complete len:518 (-),score=152.93 TRINITY_DN3870_c0_g1_i1:255-1808(-)